jgi:hypothetical protein
MAHRRTGSIQFSTEMVGLRSIRSGEPVLAQTLTS